MYMTVEYYTTGTFLDGFGGGAGVGWTLGGEGGRSPSYCVATVVRGQDPVVTKMGPRQ